MSSRVPWTSDGSHSSPSRLRLLGFPPCHGQLRHRRHPPTILVKVLFIPLTNRSMKSMRDMQRLQPQMAKMREKFKDDRERLNKEMIELYRRHRVNPLGGCLPMLLQFPVFIGLYQALSQAIELRHARFAFWVHDLSAHECYPWPGRNGQWLQRVRSFGFPIPFSCCSWAGA